MRCVPQLKIFFISVGSLKVLGLEISGRDGILKMLKGSMVVLKGVRRSLKGNTVIRQVAISISLNDYCTRL